MKTQDSSATSNSSATVYTGCGGKGFLSTLASNGAAVARPLTDYPTEKIGNTLTNLSGSQKRRDVLLLGCGEGKTECGILKRIVDNINTVHAFDINPKFLTTTGDGIKAIAPEINFTAHCGNFIDNGNLVWTNPEIPPIVIMVGGTIGNQESGELKKLFAMLGSMPKGTIFVFDCQIAATDSTDHEKIRDNDPVAKNAVLPDAHLAWFSKTLQELGVDFASLQLSLETDFTKDPISGGYRLDVLYNEEGTTKKTKIFQFRRFSLLDLIKAFENNSWERKEVFACNKTPDRPTATTLIFQKS